MNEETQQRPQNMISRSMSIGAIIERLVNHGCPDISNRLDMTHCNETPYSRGGFGDVHQGFLRDGTKVALKCLRLYVRDNQANDKALKHAARELHTWSKCRHPNIVELLGLAEFRGQIAMISPWMENGSIDRLDNEDDTIDRYQLCLSIAQGLMYLHGINIVHGDLKGGNVLLSNNGGVQLADFGNAVLASSALLFTESSSIRSGFSVRWAAPEQLQGEVTYSREADVYSLGMTVLVCHPTTSLGEWTRALIQPFYTQEIISRQQPYACVPNEAAVIVAILIERQHPKRPEDTIPAKSWQGDALWSLLESCWSWNPKDRPEVPSVVKKIETIKSKGLLAKAPETTAMSSLSSLTISSIIRETKRRPESLELESELQKKRPRLEMDKLVQTPIAHQHLISKAKDMLDYIARWEVQDLDHFFTEFALPKLKYGVGDLMELLSEIRQPGMDAPETPQLELLYRRVYDFQQTAPRLLLQLKPYRDPSDEATLDRLEIVVSQGLQFPLYELRELEQMVARLQFSCELQTVNVNGLTLDQVDELIVRGQDVGVSSYHRVMTELEHKATSGRQWKATATSILAQPRPDMKDLDQLVASAHSIPTLPDVLGKLTRVWLRGREYEKQVEACLRPLEETQISIDGAAGVATTALNEVYFPAAEELRMLLDEARTWEATCEDIITGQFKARGTAMALDEVRALRDKGKAKFGAFYMPWFEKVVQQLAVHDDWISLLPWTRLGLSALGLDSVVRDVTGVGDAECVPPTNQACTCVCAEPVVVGESGLGAEVAQCDHCLVMFHAKCIEGSCPFCDDQSWNGFMGEPLTFKQQHLGFQYEAACELTKYYSSEYRALRAILFDRYGESALVQPINKLIGQLGRCKAPDPTAIPQIRHLMRRLYRIQLEISARPEVFSYGLSLAHLHRQIVMQPRTKRMTHRKPRFLFKSEMNSDPWRTWRCLCGEIRRTEQLPRCSKCQTLYHAECIALSGPNQVPEPFVCPLCLLKEGESYGPAEVRVTYHDDHPEENAKFVDVKACLDNYSWSVIRRALPPPVRPTITVELYLFIPGTNPDFEEPEPHPKPASRTPVESTPRQRTNESLDSDSGFRSGSETC